MTLFLHTGVTCSELPFSISTMSIPVFLTSKTILPVYYICIHYAKPKNVSKLSCLNFKQKKSFYEPLCRSVCTQHINITACNPKKDSQRKICIIYFQNCYREKCCIRCLKNAILLWIHSRKKQLYLKKIYFCSLFKHL